jgi:hypothetical protein
MAGETEVLKFPRMIYHRTKGERVVEDLDEHELHLGNGWQEKPIEAGPEVGPKSLAERVEALEARVSAIEAVKKKK